MTEKIYYTDETRKVKLWQNKLMSMSKEHDFELKVCLTELKASVRFWNGKEFRPLIEINDVYQLSNNLNGVMAVMHEIGHVIDLNRFGHHTRTVFAEFGLLEFEVRAWEHSFKIARKIGFNEFNILKEYSLYCLRTYYDDLIDVKLMSLKHGFKGKHPSWEEAVERINQAHKQAIKAFKSALLRV